MEDFLQLLAASAYFFTFTILQIISITSIPFVLLYCEYLRWFLLTYLLWIYLDRKTMETGGRRSNWPFIWMWWKYIQKYFSYKLETANINTHFDKNKNYLLCTFPHGLICFGNFMFIVKENRKFLQFHNLSVATLNLNYYVPFVREIFLSNGGVSASAKSLKYILNKPIKEGGGQAVMLYPGGASEAYHCIPDTYTFILKNRKGFVKMALQTGTNLVPVISFNENNTFDQYRSKTLYKIQELIRKYCTFTPIIFKAKYLVCPYKVPITTLVGEPIEVVKNEHPSQKDIDNLHSLFIEKIQLLFEENKHKYINNANEIFLRII